MVSVVCSCDVYVLWEDWEVSEYWGSCVGCWWVVVLALLLRAFGLAVEEGLLQLMGRVLVVAVEKGLLQRGFNLMTPLLLLKVYE